MIPMTRLRRLALANWVTTERAAWKTGRQSGSGFETLLERWKIPFIDVSCGGKSLRLWYEPELWMVQPKRRSICRVRSGTFGVSSSPTESLPLEPRPS